MTSSAPTVHEYLAQLPAERQAPMQQLIATITENLPEGFEPRMSYGMVTWVVPHSTYPAGYHCNPKQALPFLSLASQKNFIALYHMGLYAKPELLDWFVSEYPKHSKTKLDMGKSCIRFKKPEQIPFELLAELFRKMTVEDYIETYQTNLEQSR